MGIETRCVWIVGQQVGFLYARYMGIETTSKGLINRISPFLYARYMGIETIETLLGLENVFGSCTLAIWVLKLEMVFNPFRVA